MPFHPAAARPAAHASACGRAVLLLLGALFLAPALAQKYPAHPVRIVVPFPPGSAPDQTARIVGQELQNSLGQSFVADNKPGAQGAIAATEVAKSPNDGYTLLLTTNTTQAANVSLFKKLPYDPVKDFAPVTRIGGTALMLMVRNDFHAHTLKDLIAYARANPDKLSAGYGSSATQVAIGMLQTQGKLHVLSVPYKGVPQTALDVMAGQISFSFVDAAVGLAQIRGGKLRALGVTSLTPNRLAPDLPLFTTDLPGFEIGTWYGVVAPAGTPRDVVLLLNNAIQKGLNKPDVREHFSTMGLDMMLMGPDEFGPFIKSEVVKWAGRIKDAGIQPE
ncbi:MAG TPA: tripartite tricarboxylate transporter substrate-binding protein [Burkholderiales bacterium]|jgi:tripartite-type tricarboxylate transporter receptor subunit TctC